MVVKPFCARGEARNKENTITLVIIELIKYLHEIIVVIVPLGSQTTINFNWQRKKTKQLIQCFYIQCHEKLNVPTYWPKCVSNLGKY